MKNLILSITALFITLSVSSQTIVDAAASNKDFSTLVTALKAADLVGALSGEGPFTVFAPNNDAFGKIDSETLGSLLKPENVGALSNILTYLELKIPPSESSRRDPIHSTSNFV